MRSDEDEGDAKCFLIIRRKILTGVCLTKLSNGSETHEAHLSVSHIDTLLFAITQVEIEFVKLLF